MDSSGNLFVADQGNSRVSKGTPLPGPQFQFLNISTRSTGQVSLVLGGAAGATFVIESSADLKAWAPLQTNSLSVNGVALEDFPVTTAPGRGL
jgi:hypothetical protein